MNKLPKISINAQFPEIGFWNKIELDPALLFPKLKEDFGIDLQSVVIPFLAKLTRMMIRKLELTQQIQELSKEDEQELADLQEQAKNLQVWSNHYGINYE